MAGKALIPVGYAKAEALGTYGPCSWANVFYFVIGSTTGHTPGDVVSSVAEAVHEFYNNVWKGNVPTNWSLQRTKISYRDADDSIVRVTVTDVVTGTNETDEEGGQVAYLVNWSTSDIRRGGKPRTYVPGVHQLTMADAAHLVPAFVSSITALLNTWLTSLPTPAGARLVAMQLVDMSFVNAKAFRPTPISFPIIGVSLNNVVATQRRRVNRLRS